MPRRLLRPRRSSQNNQQRKDNMPTIETASVKVMRSHDYCHFEVALSSSVANSPEAVDELRKTAARLADKAVEQYKVAKENAEQMVYDARGFARLQDLQSRILKKPESDHTPQEKAVLKAIADRLHRSRRCYDYEDQWEEEEAWQDIEEPGEEDVKF